jgi:sugar phosphate permease
LYLWIGREPQRGAQDHIRTDSSRSSFLGLFTNGAFLTATLGLAMLTFAMGGISTWVPTFLHRSLGYPVPKASFIVSAITAFDGIVATALGGWLAQRWLRVNDRALYLFSALSVSLTLPLGALVFFGPHATAIPALFLAEFFLFLNTGPLNTAIVNSVSAPVRATAISVNLFCIHALGDTFSPQIIGAVSDRTGSLSLALGLTLVSLSISAIILQVGSRFAPRLND